MPTQWFTGKGYGISSLTDVTGRPLLTYQGPQNKKPILLADRVAQTFDFTVKQRLTAGAMTNGRMDSATASAAKKVLGGVADDELDHKISLELGGSNTPANLFIQHGITAGASAASDQLENQLAIDVVNGKISLLDAWRVLEDQKGFLIAEDVQAYTNVDIGGLMMQLAGGLKDYITGKKRADVRAKDQKLVNNMNALIAALSKNPQSKPALTAVIQAQLDLNKQQYNGDDAEAAKMTKMTIAAYAASKGISPQEIIGAADLNIQRIINNSVKDPNVYGISTITIAKTMTIAAIALQGAALIGFALALIGVLIAGPEVIAGALTGGLFESIGGLIGVSPLAALGFGTVAITEAVSAMMFISGLGIKAIYDAGYLLPTQNITALKDAIAIQKGAASFLPSAQQNLQVTLKPAKVKTTTPKTHAVYRITAPNGKTYIFQSQDQLNAFKTAAGL